MAEKLSIYAARMDYEGADALDITVKTGDKVFAPSWDLVMGSKEGRITWEEYEEKYRDMMRASYRKNTARWKEVLHMGEVTFKCFCRIGDNCHRDLLAGYFQKLGEQEKVAVEICGAKQKAPRSAERPEPARVVFGKTPSAVDYSACASKHKTGDVECRACFELECSLACE